MFYRYHVLLVTALLFSSIYNTNGVVVPVVAVGGLVTGIIGMVLSALGLSVQVGVVLGNKVMEREKMKMANMTDAEKMMMMMKSQGGEGGMGGGEVGYQRPETGRYFQRYGGRRKRNTYDQIFEKALETKQKVENFTDRVYKNDHSQCVEKMICNIYQKSYVRKQLSYIETSILNLVESNSNHGPTYKKMLIAKMVGAKGDDCDFLFSSCPLKASQMIRFIGYSAKRFKI
ncbi:UNVERIFIED_CONTAM: hypothetical protein RMT77_000601 [Armadillidium vulgare]